MEWRIKIHRQIDDRWRRSKPNTFSLFLYLLTNANIKPSYLHWHFIDKWDCVVGRKSTSKHLGMTEQQLRTSLEHLKSTNEITIKTTSQFSIITVCKWEEYQSTEKKQPTKQPTNQPTSNQQVTTSWEGKNKEYNIDSTKTQSIKYILSDWELIEERGLDILEEFVNYWSEPNKAGKEKRQLERTWDTNLRLKKWKKNKDTNFGTKQIIDYEIVDNYHIAYLWWKLEDVKQYFKNKYPTDRQNKYRQAKEKYRNSDLFIKAVK